MIFRVIGFIGFIEFIGFIGFPFCAFPCHYAYAEELSVSELPALTLEECVNAALANNPKLKEAVLNVDFNKAGVGTAKSAYLPQAKTSAGYTHFETSKIALGGSTAISDPNLISRLGFAKKRAIASESTSIEQLIWDFGKTLDRIKLAKENLTTAQYAFLEAREKTLFDAKNAYYGVLKAQLYLDTAGENFALSNVHLDRAKGFFEVGLKQKYDITKAEVEVSKARLDLVKAKKGYSLARVALNNIMGRSGDPDYRVADAALYKPVEVTIDEALKLAMDNRVELLKRQSEARAALDNFNVKKKGNWPAISASGAHQVSNTDTEGIGNVRDWNAGVSLNFPWFDGFRTKSEIEAAEAALKIARLAIEDQSLSIALEVRDAVLNLGEAGEALAAADKYLQQAAENLEIANARYEEGLGSIIEVTDAGTYLVSAKQSRAAAISDYLISQAKYEKSVGIIAQSVIK